MTTIAIVLAMMMPHQDFVMRSGTRYPLPDLVSTSAEIVCDGRRVSIDGLNGWGPDFDGPRIRYNGRAVDMSPDLIDYLAGEEAATYRISGTCPERGPAVSLILYRASAAVDGTISYAIRGIDVDRSGTLTDKGSEVTSDADAFWYR